MAKRKILDYVVDQIVNLYQQGYSGPEIAKKLGISKSSVYRYLEQRGVKRREYKIWDSFSEEKREELRRKIRERMKKNNPMKNPEIAKKVAEKLRIRNRGKGNPHYGKHHSEETKKLLSMQKKIQWSDPDSIYNSEEYRRKLGLSKRGPRNPNYGGLSEEHRRNVSIAVKKFFEEHPEIRERISRIQKERWKDPKYRKKVISKVLKSVGTLPTSYEKKVMNMIKLHNLPFRYVGKGQLCIGDANPDFVHEKEKKVIEVYSSVWKEDNYEERRREHFRKFGYDVLFLNEYDVRCILWPNIVLEKILRFIEK